MNKIVYIHGLNSSSNATIANVLRERFGDLVHAPSLPNNPAEWGDFLNEYFKQFEDEMVTVIGSSTGGFFADFFGDKFGFHKVLINPLVDYTDLNNLVGKNKNFHTGVEWDLSHEDVKELGRYVINNRKTIPTYLFLGVNDDVLDYRKAEDIFQGRSLITKNENGHVYKLSESDLDTINKSLWVTCFY